MKVVLNSAVTWSLDLAGGTQRTEADLRGGKVAGVAVTAGSAELDVSLPRPAGTVPFLLAGGVSLFRLSLPGGVPAQVTVGGGASFVSVDDQNLTGIAGGTVLTPPGWATATLPLRHRRHLRVLPADGQPLVRRRLVARSPPGRGQRAWIGRKT